MTLERLKDKIVKGGKAVDIGTGSGYVAACLAELMGKGS
jgi:protein-L-isoaspartate O-methyltransferase